MLIDINKFFFDEEMEREHLDDGRKSPIFQLRQQFRSNQLIESRRNHRYDPRPVRPTQ